MMKVELVLLNGSNQTIALEEGVELSIGTSSQCAVRLTALDASRSHALITCKRGTISLLDLGSTNGTYVNGRRVKDAVLQPGDVVRFSSVIAQVMPLGSGSGGLDASPDPDGETPVHPAREHDSASGDMPIILQDSLLWLLQRWDIARDGALLALVEWLVARRGMHGAAIAEQVDGEAVVRAAHDVPVDVLDDPRVAAVVGHGSAGETGIETVQTRLGEHEVVALHGPGLPCLLLLAAGRMPSASDIELYVALLRMAQRLELAAAPSRKARPRTVRPE